ncbi:Glycerophosphodiester phosphodiesterase GDE1 [Lachnellula suecica]|uniref:Glycerophosphodiester phosphodiesterase GDE1 n=1 Tax=Lachnellula suecica TaxID=602035 RepID=A0A8T9C0N5_9HELO|nr:Glycerophosphodiester phosphodiesterase GDE1 [Lachnellula suecica]
MKFGRNLPRNQVPEWSASYINYKGLKKLIKAAAATAKSGNDVDLAEFFFSLDRNLDTVDGFYNKKFADASRRLKLLQERYAITEEGLAALDRSEIEEIMGALLELRGQLRNLQGFGELNRRGFVKITKKLDKKVPNICTQQRYLASKVDPKPFATNSALTQALKTTNEWLEALGETKGQEDNASVNSAGHTHTIKRVSSRSIVNLPHGLLDTVDGAIRNDDVPILKESLAEVNLDSDDPGMQKLFVTLLQRAISCKSKKSIGFFLKAIKSLDESDDINHRNCLHRLVVSIGRAKSDPKANFQMKAESNRMKFLTPATPPPPGPAPSKLNETNLLSSEDESVKLLAYVLDSLQPHQRASLKTRDTYGRFPLHYAAQYGFVVICELVMKRMQDWGQFNVEHGIDSPEWQDSEGLAPLHLSVIGGHRLTTQALLKAENWQGLNDHKAAMRRDISKSSAVLAIATKSDFTHIVKLLVDAGVDINWQDETGETALHVAARFGHEDCAKTLLNGTVDQKANVELAEKSFSWTPLHVACVDGHLSIVELLIEAGAEVNKTDASGWTAREHAALRGHLVIAGRLSDASEGSSSGSEDSRSTIASSPPKPKTSSLEALRSQNSSSSSVVRTESVKTFGHRYLTKESLILVSLGSMDMRKECPAVQLENIPISKAHSTQLDTALSLIVTASGAQGEPMTIDLPVQDNISTEPVTFSAVDVSKVKLYFDIVPTYGGNEDNKVGRAVALLSSIKQTIGTKRMNLQGDVSVPIISKDLEVIGNVNFNFLIITPFSHPNMEITTKQTYWKEVSNTMVIGHRGLGKNVSTNRSLQLGENTLQSFIAAANLGAEYVEFDVQLTKDLVPVIYHDFLVSETGIDAPVHTLTLEQFLHVNDPTQRPSRPPSPPKESPNFRIVRGADRVRSQSLGHELPAFDEMAERMKHTRDFKAKGYKANSRGNFIHAPFTTLEEMLLKLDQEVSFNIEMKYPMLHESEEQEMDTYAVELNSFVDTVLTKVYDLGKKRKIIFSSFNPDICLLLSFKQPSIPILFLTDAGVAPVGDIRASSLQEAIRFASRWNLLGIVSAAEPLVNSPRLVRVVKENGLVCVSYGTLNNDAEKVNQQVQEGIDAVIVDSVLNIRQGLTKYAKPGHANELAVRTQGALMNSVGGVNGPVVT